VHARSVAGANHVVAQRIQHRELIGVEGDLRGGDALSLRDLRNGVGDRLVGLGGLRGKARVWPRKSLSPNESGLTVPVRNPRPSGE